MKNIRWNETSNCIMLVIDTKLSNEEIMMNEDYLVVNGVENNKKVKLEINFLNPIDPDNCEGKMLENSLEFILFKKESSFWGKLSKNDINSSIKWNDINDSEESNNSEEPEVVTEVETQKETESNPELQLEIEEYPESELESEPELESELEPEPEQQSKLNDGENSEINTNDLNDSAKSVDTDQLSNHSDSDDFSDISDSELDLDLQEVSL